MHGFNEQAMLRSRSRHGLRRRLLAATTAAILLAGPSLPSAAWALPPELPDLALPPLPPLPGQKTPPAPPAVRKQVPTPAKRAEAKAKNPEPPATSHLEDVYDEGIPNAVMLNAPGGSNGLETALEEGNAEAIPALPALPELDVPEGGTEALLDEMIASDVPSGAPALPATVNAEEEAVAPGLPLPPGLLLPGESREAPAAAALAEQQSEPGPEAAPGLPALPPLPGLQPSEPALAENEDEGDESSDTEEDRASLEQVAEDPDPEAESDSGSEAAEADTQPDEMVDEDETDAAALEEVPSGTEDAGQEAIAGEESIAPPPLPPLPGSELADEVAEVENLPADEPNIFPAIEPLPEEALPPMADSEAMEVEEKPASDSQPAPRPDIPVPPQDFGRQRLPAQLYADGGGAANRHLPKRLDAQSLGQLAFNASARNAIDPLRSMLDSGLGSETRNESGDTLLSWAVRYRAVDAARLLLARGANPNAINNQGVSPLHYAVLLRNRPLVQALLASGADGGATAPDGRTPHELAYQSSDPQLYVLFQQYGREGQQAGIFPNYR